MVKGVVVVFGLVAIILIVLFGSAVALALSRWIGKLLTRK